MGRLSYEARRARERQMRHMNASTAGPVGDCWFTGMAMRHDHVWPQPIAEQNPLHNGEWFVQQGKLQAYEESRPFIKMLKWLLVFAAIGAAYSAIAPLLHV